MNLLNNNKLLVLMIYKQKRKDIYHCLKMLKQIPIKIKMIHFNQIPHKIKNLFNRIRNNN